eukprot:TRINITY_DN630_c0_g1_i2.p1 TRINITY_DN630_c0_g1~~TRINITY_DN630_c0_g1_i2.p1  ORF type:complete len:409 (-),score=83.00 TRINITY_DN630_c0_g1_i2:27-1196(-)
MEQTVDFANYFCTYGYLYEQKQMLCDEIRMQAYYDAIFRNAPQFKDKVVLDVGTGTGILAIWAAQAGAIRVYAVEATDMAQKAQKLVNGNNVADKVIVMQGKIEDVDIPEKVDIIISEWMGLFLLRESMLDSVLFARDKWLAPGGSLYPSHARMCIAAISTETEERNKYHAYVNSMEDWNKFVPRTLANYGVDMACLTPDFDKEHADYYLATSVWCELKQADLLTDAVIIKTIDCNTCTLEEIKSVQHEFSLKINRQTKSMTSPKKGGGGGRGGGQQRNPQHASSDVKFTGFAGWFEVDFKGSTSQPATTNITLSTAPHIGYTHWGQQCFFFHPPVDPIDSDIIEGRINIVRRKDNQRLMNVEISHKVKKNNQIAKTVGAVQNNQFHMD